MLDCFCGGDLCVCKRHGEYECPRCDGTGDDGLDDRIASGEGE